MEASSLLNKLERQTARITVFCPELVRVARLKIPQVNLKRELASESANCVQLFSRSVPAGPLELSLILLLVNKRTSQDTGLCLRDIRE